MKKRYLVFFIISLYLMQIPLFINFMIINSEAYNTTLENILSNSSLVFFIISIILGLVNLIMAFTNTNTNNNDIVKITMISKLVLIPYFIINFIICTLLIIGFAFVLTIFSTFILIPLFVFITYMTMIITSSYNISYLINMFKNKEIDFISFILHFIFQLVFICDVIDTIYIYKSNENMLK